jgi:3-dehydroquinate synthase
MHDAPESGGRDVLLQHFVVPYEYRVVFTRDVFSPENRALADALAGARRAGSGRHRIFVLVDGGLDQARPGLRAEIARYAAGYADCLDLCAPPEPMIGGEGAKNDPGVITGLQSRFQALKLDRHAFVIAVGGGAMLDAAGYAVATTHRGLRMVRVPTTVLAQNDSGVGVKNGINAFGTKNFLGTFAPPFVVINDIRLLDTLSERDRIAGMAEAVKVSLIRSAPFFGWLEAQAGALRAFDEGAMQTMIRRGAELHLQHIATSGDPFETGSARPLDFGHWSAHKLEGLTRHGLRHGEAVAIGMALDTRYAVEIGMIGEPELDRVCGLMERLGLRLWSDALIERGEGVRLRLLDGLDEFREHLGGELTITLLEGIGRGVEVHEVNEDALLRALDWLEARSRGR